MAIEKLLVEHCAATLASIKTASLFSAAVSSKQMLREQIDYWNARMKEKGICLFVLRVWDGRALIYVYRKRRLKADLKRPEVRTFLKSYGYINEDLEDALEHLKSRFLESSTFPHEIGVFLDYPLEDVKGFIKNKGQNYKLCGIWKVYCNENDAKKLFQKYQKCREIYLQLWERGKSVMQLTVAA